MVSQTIVIYRLTYKGIEGPGQAQCSPTLLPAKFDDREAVRVHDTLTACRAVQHCLIDVKGNGVSMILVTVSHGLAGERVALADGELKVSFLDPQLVADKEALEGQTDAKYAEVWKLFHDRGERFQPRQEAIAEIVSKLRQTRSDYVFAVDSFSVTGRALPAAPAVGRSVPASTNDPSLALLTELASLLGQIAQISYTSPPSF